MQLLLVFLRIIFWFAWDNRWHLSSVVFNSKEKTTVGIALYGYGSQLWVDGMALFEVGDGKKYTSENMVGFISPGYDAQYNSCALEDNVIQNATLEDTGSDFWQTGNGWKNGFLSVAESQYEYGNSLKYTASANPSGVHYIKWLTVEPNTEYTFSADIKILQEGKGALVLVDGKMRDSVSFMTVEFNVGDWGSDWFELCFTFNTDIFTTLGVGVCDMGGEALIDNLRLFKSEDGINAEDDFIAKADGWYPENGKWAYYENGKKVTDKWLKDSVGWCYVGADGYCVTNKWVADSVGWCYLDGSGRMATNKWIKDSVGWCYVGDNGYCVTNKWVKDSKGWCYLDDQGRMAVNRWIKDSQGWCYVGDNGYCVTNTWKKDSKGWCYLDENGRMAVNRWVRDSKGWCYVGGDGYAVTNCWKKDSKGWCYLDGEGSMTKNDWVSYNGDWYYLDQNGYMVAGKTLTINGTSYTFDKNGVLVA